MKHLLSVIILLVAALQSTAALNTEALYEDLKHNDSPSLMNMGQRYDRLNRPDSAIVCYSVVVDRLSYSQLNKEEKHLYARALTNLAVVYGGWLFDYQKALSLLLQAADLSSQTGYTTNLAYAWLNIGGIYLSCNQLYGNDIFSEEIRRYTMQGIEAALESGQWEVALAGAVNICVLDISSPQPGIISQLISRLEAADIPQEVNLRPFYFGFIHGTLAFSRHNYNEALRIFSSLSAYIPSDAMNGARYHLLADIAISRVYTSFGNYANAIEYAFKWLAEAKKAGIDDDVANAYRTISDLSMRMGDDSRSREFLLHYYAKKDSILNERQLAVLTSLPMLNQLDHLGAEIKLERIKKQRIIIATIITAAFAVLLIAFVIYLIRSRKKIREYSRQIYLKYVELLSSDTSFANETSNKADGQLSENPVAAPMPSAENQEHHPALHEATAASGQSPAPVAAKYAGSSLSSDDEQEILDKIKKVLSDTTLICDPHFSLTQLSEAVGYNYKAVSQAINAITGKNFKSLLAEYRIREASRRLIDRERYGNFTIEHIARSVGFLSRSNFSATFKSIVGISPSEFQRNARLGK